jgi:hypothetical protein
MLTRLPRRNFALFKRTKDPNKHFFMNQDIYPMDKSWAWVGRVFLPKAIAERSVNGQLEAKTVESLYEYFGRLFPSARLDVSNYENDRHNSIGCLGVKALTHVQFIDLLEHLRTGVMLPTHRYRVNVEQEMRKEMVTHMTINPDLYIPVLAEQPLEVFVKHYANILENHVNISHMYKDEGVLGSPGSLDAEPEVILRRKAKEHHRRSAGNDLESDAPENRNWVNSVMSYLHG